MQEVNMQPLKKIDHAALKANQLTIIILCILAFVLDYPWLVAAIALVMLIGTLFGFPGFLPVYRYLLKPAGILKPDILLDNPEPHRFAQGLGALFLTFGSLALFFGQSILGWGLVWLVVGLAALNAFAGFCAGCMVYYWLSRMHIPGFDKTPPGDTFPGLRPNTRMGPKS